MRPNYCERDYQTKYIAIRHASLKIRTQRKHEDPRSYPDLTDTSGSLNERDPPLLVSKGDFSVSSGSVSSFIVQ
jgi:hypothetical protein